MQLRDGCIFVPEERIWRKDFSLSVDMELNVVELGQEHIIAVLIEQSYKKAFDEEFSIYLPRVLWKDRRLQIRGQNRIICQMGEEGKIEPGYEIENSYDREVFKKTFELEEKIMEEQVESYGLLQQVKLDDKNRGFAQMSRLPLADENGNCIGILILYEFLEKREDIEYKVCWLLRQSAVLEESLRQQGEIAFSMQEDERGSVDYISSNITKTGYEPEDFYAGTLGWLDLVCEEDKKLLTKCQGDIEERTYRIRAKDGETLWVYEKVSGIMVYQDKVFRYGSLWIKQGE